MKSSKVSSAFLNKFSPILAKFKSSSTINVAHQQIRKLFGEYTYTDIILTFTSKMDNSDNLTDKEKKQYSKIYITLLDAYGQQVILNHYERLIQSIAKKNVGVAEVISHLCKTLLNRIYPTQNIGNYIKHLLIAFEKNLQIAKIIKQIIESFDPQLTQPFQHDMVMIINDKILLPKFKIECLQAILAIILSLQDKFTEEHLIQPLVSKNFKSDDWTTRKLCVDIAYALLVVNNEANAILHQYIKQLKYDKIKHVRDAVSNYNAFYKQIYGQQKCTTKKYTQPDFHNRANRFQKNMTQQLDQNYRQKSIKKNRNKQFFQNAKNKDVIKISENRSNVMNSDFNTAIQTNQIQSPIVNNFVETNNSIDFQTYLHDKSPHQINQKRKQISSNQKKKLNMIAPKSPKNQIKFCNSPKNCKDQTKIATSPQFKNVDLKAQFDVLKYSFSSFQQKLINRLDDLQVRVSKLQKNHEVYNQNKEKLLQESFNKRFNNKQDHSQPSMSSNEYLEISESNLPEKIRQSIINKNWDQAYTLALSNKNKQALFQLLSHQTVPNDNLIRNCLLMEVRKNLSHLTVLKWLLHFIQTSQIGEQVLIKIQKDIQQLPQKIKGTDGDNRNYWMLKKMISNEISQKMFGCQ